MVEGVKEFAPEFQVGPLCYMESLKEGHIQILEAWSVRWGRWPSKRREIRLTDGRRCWGLRKGRRIQELRDSMRSFMSVDTLPGDDISVATEVCSSGYGAPGPGRTPSEGDRESVLQGVDPLRAPATDNRVKGT